MRRTKRQDSTRERDMVSLKHVCLLEELYDKDVAIYKNEKNTLY